MCSVDSEQARGLSHGNLPIRTAEGRHHSAADLHFLDRYPMTVESDHLQLALNLGHVVHVTSV